MPQVKSSVFHPNWNFATPSQQYSPCPAHCAQLIYIYLCYDIHRALNHLAQWMALSKCVKNFLLIKYRKIITTTRHHIESVQSATIPYKNSNKTDKKSAFLVLLQDGNDVASE